LKGEVANDVEVLSGEAFDIIGKANPLRVIQPLKLKQSTTILTNKSHNSYMMKSSQEGRAIYEP
jgi:hypothetical protein